MRIFDKSNKAFPLMGAAVLLGTALFLTTTSRADDEDDVPPEVTLRGFAFAGSGCPADSVRGEFPTDGKGLLVFLERFEAEAGADVPVRDKRKNCQLNIDLEHTPGWHYAVESISYRGRVAAEEGITAEALSSYYFQGQAETYRFETSFEGPVNRGFRITDAVDPDDALWSPCELDRSLNVNLQVRLATGDGPGSSGRISLKADRGVILSLIWRPCGDAPDDPGSGGR